MVQIKPIDEVRKALAEKLRSELGKGLKPIVEASYDGTWSASDWENEILNAHAYKGKLYFYVMGKGVMEFEPGVGVKTSLPYENRCLYHAGIFKEKFYRVGDLKTATPGVQYPLVYRFDGSKWEEVFRGDAANSTCGAICQYGGELYVGAKNVIYRSPSGDPGTWVSDFTFATDKTIYALVPLPDGNLYAFEGEPSTTSSRVYRKSGGAWSLYRTYDVNDFTLNHDGARGILGSKAVLGSHDGRAFLFDGTKLLCFKQTPAIWAGVLSWTQMWPKVIEGGRAIITQSSHSSMWHQSKVWVWDGLMLRKVIELPWMCTGVELLRDRLYLTGNTTISQPLSGADRDVRLYTPHWGFLLSLPIDALTFAEVEPAVFRVWVDKAMTGGVAYNSDDDGGVLIPCFGYGTKTVEFLSTADGTLTISVDSDGSGTYRTFDTVPIYANTPKYWQTTYDFAFLRLSFTPTADATVNAKVNLA
jgi:hypothetical protein